MIVTRPAEQAGPLLQALQQRGYTTRHLPLMDIVPLGRMTPAAFRLRARMNLDEYRAGDCYQRERRHHRAGMARPLLAAATAGHRIFFYAVGPSTAEVLEQAHLTVHCPAERFDSEGILALPGLQPEVIAGQKVLLWRGVGGREKLAAVLRERGAQVDYAELYERREQHYSAGPVASRPCRISRC